VWLTPDLRREAEAKDVLAELGLDEQASSFVARYGTIGDQRAIVAAAWDVPALQARYDEFLEEFSATAPLDDEAAFIAHSRLVDRWRHFPFVDPGLPPGLLAGRWSGTDAAVLFHDRHEAWRDRSRAWFDAVAERHDAGATDGGT
jgi:phenylacetic acid degradation operon negative regulatory protein